MLSLYSHTYLPFSFFTGSGRRNQGKVSLSCGHFLSSYECASYDRHLDAGSRVGALQGYPTHCSIVCSLSRSIPDTPTQLLPQPYVHSLEPLGFPHLHVSLCGEHGKGGSWPFTYPHVPLETPAGGPEVSPLPILCHSLFSSPFLQLPAS